MPDEFAAAGRLVRLMGMCGPGTMVLVAHRRGSRTPQTVGRADSQRIDGINRRRNGTIWHYLALFWGVPISESQVSKRVVTCEKPSRYTRDLDPKKGRGDSGLGPVITP